MAGKRLQMQSKSSKTMSLDRWGHKNNNDCFADLQPAENPLKSSLNKSEKETKSIPNTPQSDISIDTPIIRERSSSSVGKEAETE